MYIIGKIQEALEKHGIVDIDKAIKDSLNGIHPLEESLIKLASLSDIKEEFEPLDTQIYNPIFVAKSNQLNQLNQLNQSNKSKYDHSATVTGWAKGTGYGNRHDTHMWDPTKYLELQNEKDIQILDVLQKAVNCFKTSDSTETTILYDIVKKSFLGKFLRTHLHGSSMIDIGYRRKFYLQILTLLQNFVTEDGIFLLADEQSPDIYNILKELEQEGQTMKKFADTSDTNLELINTIIMLYDIATPAYIAYKKKQTKPQKQEIQVQDIKTQYVEELGKLRYRDQCDFASKSFMFNEDANLTPACQRSLAREYGSLGKTLPIYYDSSIFVRVDEQMNKMRVLITGPDNTPYDSGVYLFDVYCNSNYPLSPPKMYMINTGNVRQNPNLYANGKVCLSLLGTWEGGSKGEGWGSHSTLTQLFVSVQSQILHNNPFWNEPGHEGCSEEKQTVYRQYVRYYNMKHAMINIIQSVKSGNYSELSEVILTHFRLKKNYILETCKKWCDASENYVQGPQQNHTLSKDDMIIGYNCLKNILNKL